MNRESTGGYVLAGGRSSRMGQNKAKLPWRGRTLIEHVCSEVFQAAGTVTVVGNEVVGGIPAIPDRFPGFGPVGGIATALAHTQSEWNLIVACDMPMVCADSLRSLFREVSGLAVIPASSDGRLHPLCAVWSRKALCPLQQAVQNGVHAVKDVISRISFLTVRAWDDTVLMNANTPEEWAQAVAISETVRKE